MFSAVIIAETCGNVPGNCGNVNSGNVNGGNVGNNDGILRHSYGLAPTFTVNAL